MKYYLLRHFPFYKLFNTSLRIFPLGMKFLFIAILSKYISVTDYGNYLLITTTITISIFVLGLDYYNFSIRNVLKEKVNVFPKIYNAFILYFIIYFIFILIGCLFFNNISFIRKNGVMLIILLCITEHLNQEIYRLQIAFKKILTANIVFFLRVFVWTTYLVLGLLFFNIKISVNYILALWLGSNLFAIGLNALIIWKEIFQIKHIPSIDLKYLISGLKVSSLFFIGTISLKSIEYINRYIVDIMLGSEETGIFSFYSNFIMVITVYVNAIVISFELPELIERAHQKDLSKYFKKFQKSLLTQIIIMSSIILIAIKPILWWQGIEIYRDHLYILFFLLAGVGLMNYSLSYHFFLYVKEQDKKILKLTVIVGAINLVLTIILTYFLGLLGTSIAFTLTGGFMFYLRFVNAKYINYG